MLAHVFVHLTPGVPGGALTSIFLFFAVFFLTDFADKEGLFSVFIVKPF